MLCFLSEFLSLFLFVVAAAGREHGPDVTTVVVSEFSDALLPCSLSTKENLQGKHFNWIKDNNVEVFFYNASVYPNNSHPGFEKLLQERTFHLPEQLTLGNASIKIEFVKLEDAGNYTCIIPRLQAKEERSTIRLVVEPILRDRSLEIPGALVKPFARILDSSVEGVLLRCEVHGAVIKPTVRWLDGDGNVPPTMELTVDERGGRYFVYLLIAVQKTYDNYYRCEATQEEISHRVYDDVSVPEQMFESCPDVFVWIAVWFSGVLSLAAVLAMVTCTKCIIKHARKRSRWPITDWSFEPELKL
uniref:Ig-like domain-containing protein n=1 Tax=Amphiprion percula TaxID=161767 RepID=A0A3P8U7D0_AMPPE